MDLKEAFKELGKQFHKLNWSFVPEKNEVISYWPGDEKEEVMVCVLNTHEFNEVFPRQDFFFLNYAYKNSFEALSENSENLVKINENDSYIGQPYNGYAIRGKSEEEITIIGLLIKKETFYKEFLTALAVDYNLFHFFLDPQSDQFSQNFIHISFKRDDIIRKLLELMVIEYANKSEETQEILKSLTLSLLICIFRKYRNDNNLNSSLSLAERFIQYIYSHKDKINLELIAEHFSYHPNYISSLLHQKTGKTFSQILLEQRMDKALTLLNGTSLSIEEISAIVGFNTPSNFYRQFKKFYNKSPREYLKQN